MKRRTFITVGPVTLMASCGSPAFACAIEMGGTPVQQAYDQWRAFWEHINGPATNGVPNEEFDLLVEQLDAMAHALLSIPAETPTDFIMKVIASTDWGQGAMPDLTQMPQLWTEARALIGGAA